MKKILLFSIACVMPFSCTRALPYKKVGLGLGGAAVGVLSGLYVHGKAAACKECMDELRRKGASKEDLSDLNKKYIFLRALEVLSFAGAFAGAGVAVHGFLEKLTEVPETELPERELQIELPEKETPETETPETETPELDPPNPENLPVEDIDPDGEEDKPSEKKLPSGVIIDPLFGELDMRNPEDRRDDSGEKKENRYAGLGWELESDESDGEPDEEETKRQVKGVRERVQEEERKENEKYKKEFDRAVREQADQQWWRGGRPPN